MNSMNKVSRIKISSPLLSGLMYSFFWLMIAVIISSFLIHFTNMQEKTLISLVYVIHGMCLFIGGFVAGRRASSKGWYYGGLVGFIYSLLVIIIGFLGYNVTDWATAFPLIALCLSLGALGGIFGVNTVK